MNNREMSKLETRKRILNSTTKLVLENGFVKVSTKDIASASEVAQGSVFLHFESKENLLRTIISTELEKIQNEIENSINPKMGREEFLQHLIDVLVKHEPLLARIYMDLAYLNEETQKVVEHIEVLLKNLLFDNLRNFPSKNTSIVDTFICIDAFIAQIKSNLLDKDSFSEYSSILKQRRGKINKLYKTLFI